MFSFSLGSLSGVLQINPFHPELLKLVFGVCARFGFHGSLLAVFKQLSGGQYACCTADDN